MIRKIGDAAAYCKFKVDSWFKRVFKEQSGGAELVASLVIVGIVLALAFVFRDKIAQLVKNIWNSMFGGNVSDKGIDDAVSGVDWD